MKSICSLTVYYSCVVNLHIQEDAKLTTIHGTNQSASRTHLKACILTQKSVRFDKFYIQKSIKIKRVAKINKF